MNIMKILNKHKSLDDMAGEWFLRLSEDGCTKADHKDFGEWRAQEASHDEAYRRIEKSQKFVDHNISHPLLGDLMDEVLAETETQSFKSSWAPNRWVLSGAVAACLLIVTAVQIFYSSQGFEDIVVHDTVVGERSTITLSDGSTVILNTNSRVEIDYTDEQRGLTLVRGQAIFEVAKNKNWPFVVEVGDQRITALGTEFDVRLDKDVEAVEIVLVEGRVAVDQFLVNSPKVQRQVLPSKRVELTQGERLVVSSDAPRTVDRVDLEKAVSWKNGKIIFRKDPLSLAVKEINRYSVEKIRLADDPRVRGLKVSGVFNTGQIRSFVYVLESTYNLDVQRTGKTEITLIWRE